MYIVIEGQDGTGKDTQAKLLADFFRKQGKTVIHYAESGTASENPFIADIARLNYGSEQNIEERTRSLLYVINRYEQWKKLAEPTLKSGGVVITTRNWFSTLVYQGYGLKVSRKFIIKLHKLMMPEPYFHPDKIVIFTISDEESARRLIAQGKDRQAEVFKSKGENFQKTLKQAYLTVAKDYQVPTLSADPDIETVQKNLRQLFQI